MTRPSATSFIHRRGDDNERSLCGEEDRSDVREVVCVGPYDWNLLAPAARCPRCAAFLKTAEQNARFADVVQKSRAAKGFK